MNAKILIALLRWLANDKIPVEMRINAAIHDLATYVAAIEGKPELLDCWLPQAVTSETREQCLEGLEVLRSSIGFSRQETEEVTS